MATGWLLSGAYWYYLKTNNGAMVTGYYTIDGKHYRFRTSGAWISNTDSSEWVVGELPPGGYTTYQGHIPRDESGTERQDGNLPAAKSDTFWSGDCKYTQSHDNVHVTRGEASVHGWWEQANSKCPAKANVMVHLQAWYCAQRGVCDWVTVNYGDWASYKPGTASRANARDLCSDARRVSWRGKVKVDVAGYRNTWPQWFSEGFQTENCYLSH